MHNFNEIIITRANQLMAISKAQLSLSCVRSSTGHHKILALCLQAGCAAQLSAAAAQRSAVLEKPVE